MLKGTQLAVAQLNEDGGILGEDVEVVSIDDAADPATGVKAAKSAIADGLDGIVGPYNSGVGIETLPLYLKPASSRSASPRTPRPTASASPCSR